MRRLMTVLAVLLLAVNVFAQTDPRTLPLIDLGNVTAAGAWTFDWPDGAGGDLSYGGTAVGVSEDGQFLYLACNVAVNQKGIAKLRIPALGGRATVVAPCLGPNRTEIEKLVPGWGAGTPMLGGVLDMNGRIVVAGYGSYDANNQAIASHWAGPDLAHLSGPFGPLLTNARPAGASTTATGLVKDYMGRIPSEWQGLLGGPAFATAGYTSIISRASFGLAFSVFDPATVTANGFPMTMLIGCPNSVASCVTYGTPTSNSYNGSEKSGGAFIVSGTRTLVAIERESSGPTCYGYATRNQALHGTPYPTAANPGPENVPWCYSLSDPLDQKGPKGYPYRLVAKLYDLNDAVAVKQGTKKPWDIRQYATVDLPGSSAGEDITSGAYNPVKGEYYLLRNQGGGVNTVYVYRGFGAGTGAPPLPPPVNCAGTWSAWQRVAGSETQCVGTSRNYTETRDYTITTQPANGGTACPNPLTESRVLAESCTSPPPPPPAGFTGRLRSQAEYTVGGLVAGIRVTLQVPVAQTVPAVGATVRIQIPVLGGFDTRAGTVYSKKANAYAGTTDWQVVVQLPGVQTLALRVEVP